MQVVCLPFLYTLYAISYILLLYNIHVKHKAGKVLFFQELRDKSDLWLFHTYKAIFVGPVNAAGQAYDPAAETYKKQVGFSLASTMTLHASIMI